MNLHIPNESKQPGRGEIHNLAIVPPVGLMPLTIANLMEILPIDKLSKISRDVFIGFQSLALTKLPFLVDFPQEMNMQYGDRLLEGSELKLCILFVLRPDEVEVLRVFAYQPNVLSKTQLEYFMENFMAASQLTIKSS